MSRWRKLALWFVVALLVVFLLLQLKQPERTNPPVVSEISAPPEIAEIIERACYNCHSYETDWPWYAYVAPVSWWVVDHVHEARADMNFSDWPILDFEEERHYYRDIDEQIAQDKMPLKSYRIMHPEARLSAEEKDALRRWARAHF